jgi:uncharacterized protein YbgA (DUF1722 family)
MLRVILSSSKDEARIALLIHVLGYFSRLLQRCRAAAYNLAH